MRITANKVTFARIVLLPLPSAFLLYGADWASWTAFSLFCVLGATDFVDGMMARREGPTVLGSLLDPVADKMWVAAAVLTLCGAGIFGLWFPILILLREFLLTALRTSMTLKRHPIKTSLLGKMKTIFQMGGLGTIFLTHFLPQIPLVIVMALLSGTLFFIWSHYARRGQAPVWILPVALAFLGVGLVRCFTGAELCGFLQSLVIVAITWISGISYFTESYKLFVRDGLQRHDWVRLFWVCVFCLGLCPLATLYPHFVLLVVIILSLELALGGVDNIVAAERGQVYNSPFIITASTALLAVICLYVSSAFNLAGLETNLMVALICVSASSLAWFLFRFRTIFWQAL